MIWENVKSFFSKMTNKTKGDTDEFRNDPNPECPCTEHHPKASPLLKCIKIGYVVLAVITILLSLATIVVSITTAIASKLFLYNSEQSGRLVAMIVMAITAAVTLAVTIYATIAVFKNHSRPLHATSVALFIVVIIQAVLAGVSISVRQEDQVGLGRALTESFRLSQEHSPRHIKLWAATQNVLQCCGVFSPEDYRSDNIPYFFSPDVPISCCPGYDDGRSEFVQEREREMCKAKKEYFDIGCKEPVLEIFKETADVVLAVAVALIIFEATLAILGVILARPTKNKHKKRISSSAEEEATA